MSCPACSTTGDALLDDKECPTQCECSCHGDKEQMWTPPRQVDTEADLQETVRNIDTISRHLLGLGKGGPRITIGVTPHTNTSWTAYATDNNRFSVADTKSTIGEALRGVLSELMNRVSSRMERDAKLVATIKR